MEPIKEVPLKGLGESELDREKPRVDSRDERKHTGRTDLLQHHMENRQNRQTDNGGSIGVAIRGPEEIFLNRK